MRTLPTIVLATGLTLTCTFGGPLTGQGREIRIRPTIGHGVQTVSTRVSARLANGVADTTVTLSFRNNGNSIAEKVLLFPLPKGATADRIRMKIGDKMETGEVLDKNRARQIYEGIVRKRMDPALLEYMGRDLLRLRVFPIPAHGTQDVEVRFRMLLPESGGLYSFEFPTRAVEGGTFAMDVQIHSKTAIKNVWSPVQGFDIRKKSDNEARASYETKGRPKKDPVIFYGLSDRDFGLNLLTWRKPGEPGYFMVLLAPKRDWKQEKELNKDIILVLDTSGSMQGQKIVQARAAVDYFLKSLKPGDRFNLIPFSTEARPFAAQSLPAEKAVLEKATQYVKSLEARGGTNIEEALNAAFAGLAHKELGNTWLPKNAFYEEVCPPPDEVKRVPILVFLTDGLPTVGQTDVRALLKKTRSANTSNARIFAFGVGHDVNTRLLDKMALGSRGDRDYVAPGENIEVKTSLLFEKLAHPVMTDLELRADKVQWDRKNPGRLPDLFRGSRLVVTGRYKGAGATAIRLSGKVGGEARQFVFEGTFPAESSKHDFIATIWAQRRVAQLLDAIRLNGRNAELIQEIQHIGKKFGIVTPYTSQLILEEGASVANDLPQQTRRRLGRGFLDDGGRLAGDLRRSGEVDDEEVEELAKKADKENRQGKNKSETKVALPEAVSGEKAVDTSKDLKILRDMDALDSRRSSRLVTSRRLQGKFFHLIGSTWVDRDFKKGMADKLQEIEAFSKAYFDLLADHPKTSKWLSFSTSMLIVVDGQAWLVQPPKKATK
jgi:Ca-activated chloride channel homolog